MSPTFKMFGVFGEELPQPQWVVDFLLPNGILITHTVDKEATLAHIKEDLWKKAQEYPLHARLKHKNAYHFSCINHMATRMPLENENLRLCDAGLFQPVLKLEEKKKDSEETQLKSVIGTLIGKGIQEFDALKSVEVSNFRENKKKMCERIAKERDNQPWLQQVMCLYPPDVANGEAVPSFLMSYVADGFITIEVQIENESIKLQVRYDIKSQEMMQQIMKKLPKGNISGSYCLKIINRKEYILGDYPLHRYMYIRSCLTESKVPKLILVKESDIMKVLFDGEPPPPPAKHIATSSSVKGYRLPPAKPVNPNMTCLWNVNPSLKFKLFLNGVSNVQLPQSSKHVQIRVCLYHGHEPTGSIVNSKEAQVIDGSAEFKQWLNFDLKLLDLPRMARLCFLLYTSFDKRKEKSTATLPGSRIIKEGKKELQPIAWVNMAVFDFQGILQTGSHALYMWLLADDDCLTDTALNPLGPVGCNPDKGAVQLCFDLSDYDIKQPICFPTLDKVLEVAAQNTGDISPCTIDNKLKEQLCSYIDKDPLSELPENDREIVWKLRLECRDLFPYSLPKVLTCVKWDDHVQVALMHSLLQIWETLPPEQALELLDFRYPDMVVRNFAVKCLHKLSDKQLIQYLQQLVQVLKYELYLECELVNFLLERALNNQRIGHYLFWLLKSEMHVPSVSVRFGLILEAYCYGNRRYLPLIKKQVEALKKMQLIIRFVRDMSKHKNAFLEEINPRTDEMTDQLPLLPRSIKNESEEVRKLLKDKFMRELLSDFTSPLDPGCVLGKLKYEECKLMDSKMKPLWMVWSQPDGEISVQKILFKEGDDLRQDMLTLQILHIMDDIWKEDNLDLRLNVYSCMSTGQNQGMIGIVTEAETIAQIQKKNTDNKFRAAFSKTCLYEWLKQKNQDPESLNKALEEFTMSCAGYCVATYVLGIGDRHSDNILLRENGQLVHIDFGHILGHFKRKMGFKRERVPFVLTADFVYLIQEGPKRNEERLASFKDLCVEAYLALRRKSHLLIRLFMMMTNTGIPELSSLQSIDFLRKTLVPDYSEMDARNHWAKQYDEALRNSFWAAVNFAFHNAAKNN